MRREAFPSGPNGVALKDAHPFDARSIGGFDLDIDGFFGHPCKRGADPPNRRSFGIGFDDALKLCGVAESVGEYKGQLGLSGIARYVEEDGLR